MKNLPSGTVTFLFTDIEGSTHLWQEKPEAMAISHARHDEILRVAIEANHGYIFQIVGDSFSAAFHNAVDGLYAVLSAQRALHRTFEVSKTSDVLTVRVRMGLHTGRAEILADGKYDGYATMASTQRVMSAAHGGQALLSQTTHDLLQRELPKDVILRDMGEHRLKDLRAPVRLYQINAPDLPQNFPAIKSLDTQPNNLPIQLSSFIGRDKEINEANKLLASTRMLTFIGPGGTGKTRLSFQLADSQLAEFTDGIWLVELAPLADPAYIISSLASTFGLREVQGLSLTNIVIDYLRSKQLLLILDNCEHLVDACAQLTDQLLHECPNLKIIASSREALGIDGESVYRVPSLMDEESTRLFVERATKAEPRFHLTKDNAPFIARICSRLDGIPLAIELAAARVKLFTPQQIAERLNDRFKLLTGGSRTAIPRQQTLRALIDWSYHTLNESEQRALRRLAVFSGGWTIEAAESIIGESEGLDGLAGLVNKSLVNVDEQAGASRYRFLETIRQYAMEKLVETNEANDARNRHMDYFMKFTDQVETNIFGMKDLEMLKQIEGEHDNLRTALEWATANDIQKAIQLVLNIGGFWSVRDFINEALFWCKAILQRSEAVPGYDPERAKIYSLLGWNSILLGNHKEGRAAVEAAIPLAKKTNDLSTVIFSCSILALSSMFLGDLQRAQSAILEGEKLAHEKDLKAELAIILSTHAQIIYFTTRDGVQAKAYLDESIRLSLEAGYRWTASFQAFGQARLAADLGDMVTARAKFNECAEISRQMGNKRLVYSSRSELAHALRENGEMDESLAIYQELLPGWKDLGHRAAVAHELECIAFIFRRKEKPESAATLMGAAQALRKLIDSSMTKLEEVEYEKEVAALRAGMNATEIQTAWAEGSAMTMEQAIEFVLKDG